MLSCKDLTKKIAADENLSLMGRIEVRLHLMMCGHCAVYSKELKYMQDGFKKLLNKKATVSNEVIKKLEDTIINKQQKP